MAGFGSLCYTKRVAVVEALAFCRNVVALWCNWLTRRPLKAKSPGSSPGNATKILIMIRNLQEVLHVGDVKQLGRLGLTV